MIRKAILAAGAACLATPATGFGLRTHVWIADQVYRDVADDCRVTIDNQDFAVPHETCEALRAHREAFLTGSLGPDVFPDLVVGQSVVHPGVDGGLQAEDWLERLLDHAERPDEIAFSWGYGMHFAGDTFAHTYVNNYAGGVFELFAGGTPNVELRHFRLEKYLEQYLVYSVDPDTLSVPSDFLARQLVQFDYTAAGPISSRLAAAHMRTMFGALQIAREARARAPALEQEANAREAEALRRLHEVERGLGLELSNGVPIDRRSSAFRALPRGARSRLRNAHSDYQDAVDRSRRDRALVVFTNAWVTDIEAAMQNYIAASLHFGRNMIRESGTAPRPYRERESMIAPYREWFTCYSNVLRGQPLAVGDATCERLRAMGADIAFVEAALRSSMGARARSLYLDFLAFERRLQEFIGRVAIRVASITDRNVARLLREITDPARVDATALNDAFSGSPNDQLAFRCVVDWIDADLGLRPPLSSGDDRPCDGAPRAAHMEDPLQFLPLRYAVTLAKLSLLDHDGVREVARRFGGNPAELRLTPHRRYSLLLDTVRSLDGNHQWQPRSMPLPRAERYRGDETGRSAGYPDPEDEDGGAGLPFYQTAALRGSVFARLFPRPFEGSILRRVEMRPPAYPFWPCAGDPLRGPPPPGARQIAGCPQ